MPDDSGGNNSLPPGYLAVTGQTVLASQHNAPMEDLSASLTRRLMRDGRAPMLGNLNMNGYKAIGAASGTDPQDYVTLSQLQAIVAALGTVLPGVMEIYTVSSTIAPAGWIFANGQSVLRATYPALWAAVSAGNNLAASQGAKTAGQYGPGDGSTTFTVPDLRDEFVRALAASGRAIGSSQADELESHTHTATIDPGGEHNHTVASSPGTGGGAPGSGAQQSGGSMFTSSQPPHTHGATISSTGGAETRPRNIAYPYIIKT